MLVVAVGELLVDALTLGAGGRVLAVTKMPHLGDQALNERLDLVDAAAELLGLLGGALVGVGLGGGQVPGEHRVPVVAQQGGQDAVDGVVDDVVAERGAEVVGGFGGVPGLFGLCGHT